jgi:hypothetical protein
MAGGYVTLVFFAQPIRILAEYVAFKLRLLFAVRLTTVPILARGTPELSSGELIRCEVRKLFRLPMRTAWFYILLTPNSRIIL